MSASRQSWGRTRRLGLALLAATVLGGCALAAGADPPSGRVATAAAQVATGIGSAFSPSIGGLAPGAGPALPAGGGLPPKFDPTDRGSRLVHEQTWIPFATVGGIELRHPSSRVERIGFHESNNEGAREQAVLPSAAAPTTLSTRARGTDDRTAADVVVDPDVEIRAPVSGRVLRAGGYTLYCQYRDHFVVIEPDQHPGWEVKVLHLAAAQVRAGQRVEAGVTVLAPGPTRLPFTSQVDATTAHPAWPHVHVEVVDPSIPDLPGTGGC